MSSISSASPAAVSARTRRWYDSALVQVVALTIVFTAASVCETRRLFALANGDIWWRLRTGMWILQTHSTPRTGLFSQFSSLSWVDASWGFDLLTAIAYRLFGMSGLPVLLMLGQIAVGVALFALALRTSKRFWPALVLAAVAQCCLVPVQPRPALCSIVLLAVELALLTRARSTGDVRPLYWLPLVFLLWANLDRQFSYGVVVLALFCIAAIVEQLGKQSGTTWFDNPPNAVRLGKLGLITAASFLATFVTPYTWHLHALIWQTATSTAADRYFRELHSMRFRQPQDYLLMLLAMSAFFALGRRRSRDLFLLSLLIVSAVISFRLVRDNWFVAVVAVAIVGNALRRDETVLTAVSPSSRSLRPATAALVLLICVAVVLWLPSSGDAQGSEKVADKMAESFPAGAVKYLRDSRPPQPLFNTYNWGGFLTFVLPEYPVSIDSRTNLYGDTLNIAYFKLIQAEVPLESDLTFARAQTFLLEANSPMAEALSTLPAFRVVYQDKQAVVLVRRGP